MMLFGAALFALLLGTVVSTGHPNPRMQVNRRGGYRHQSNPYIQSRHPLTQGFLCDWCVVGVEDGQLAVRENLDQIQSILDQVSALCEYCPVQDQCSEVFQTDIPAAIDEFLNMTANDVCNDAGLCDADATIQGMVMNSLRGDFARDRVIKRMLMRARIMQQKMIRMILGDDYMCTSCLDIVQVARTALLDNDTEHEIVNVLAPLCAYLPDIYQTECSEFVQSLPALMAMVANDILTDSVCTDIGFCNQTKSTPDVSATLPDIGSRFGLPGVLPVMPGGRNPFQYPGGFDRQDHFGGAQGLPGQGGRRPYGYPSRPREHPSQSRPSNGRYPFQFPSNPRPEQQPAPWYGPIKWPGSSSSRPSKPQTPQDPSGGAIRYPDINMDDVMSKVGGIMDHLPDLPDMSDMGLPDIDIPRIPGQGRNNDQYRRNRGGKRGGHGRRQRSIADWTDTDRFLGIAKDTVLEYLPDIAKDTTLEYLPGIAKDTTLEYLPEAIPDAGITILENGADENCELCKVAVIGASTWLEENTPKIKKMIFKFVLPVCKVFPSPMKEDCNSDMREFVQIVIDRITDMLQPEAVCTEMGVCGVAPEEREEEILPTEVIDVATEAVIEAKPTEGAGFDWPIPILNRWKDFKIPI